MESKFNVGDIVTFKCSPFDNNDYEHEMVGALGEIVSLHKYYSLYNQHNDIGIVVEVWEYECNNRIVKYCMGEEDLEYVGSLD